MVEVLAVYDTGWGKVLTSTAITVHSKYKISHEVDEAANKGI